tara:strand:+ start:6831 stop:8576 length:1746 start_codon:yes stop_codon:yes gene_type:complete
MTRDPGADRKTGVGNDSPPQRQNPASSIERFLDTADGGVADEGPSGPARFQDPGADSDVPARNTHIPQDEPGPGLDADSAWRGPAAAPPPPQGLPEHGQPPQYAPPPGAGDSSYPQPNPESVEGPPPGARPDETPPAAPDYPEHAPAQSPVTDPAAAAAAAMTPAVKRKGLLRRRRKATKPWHRDHAADAASADEAVGSVPPGDPRDVARSGNPAAAAAPRRRGIFGLFWAMIRFLLIGKKRLNAPRPATPRGTPRLPKLGRLPGLSRLRGMGIPVLALAGRVPGFGKLRRSAASAVSAVSDSASGNPRPAPVETAMQIRRNAAGSHIHRPLDMSRRVGRSVEIDLEKIQAAGMVTPFGERTHIAEEFRLIKRPLLLNAFEKGPNAIRNGNVIMVASSRSGEGKTFMAVNLAMSIASERDLTVLLIDADVAKPDIPNVLGFEADLGLVDLIADDRIDMSDVIMRTNIENLSVMPAGRPHHLATELLASERMGNLVSELSLRYPERVVIMDSPPALLSSVAGVLALNVGQTLFVVEAERTSQTAVDSAIGLVSACKNINLLLNKSRPLGGGERFGSYQNSYY